MKFSYLLVLIFIIFASCETPLDRLKKQVLEDSIQRVANHMVDSIKNQVSNDVSFDTVGSSKSGIIITKMHLIQSDGGNYKNVELFYKNISGKKITAIRFSWYGENAFGEPADLGNMFSKGFGGGFDDNGLGVGSKTSGTWDILSRNAKTLRYAWPTEIVFSDGTKWKSTFKIN